jgi:predicted amidohydrolase YtcJ
MRLTYLLGTLLLALTPVGPAIAQQPSSAAPDLILYNGQISTLDLTGSTLQALAVRNGDIVATGASGSIQALAGSSTQQINLNGRRVLPGLIDGHLHGLRNGYHCFSRSVRLDNVFSREQALNLYRAKGEAFPPDVWIWTTAGWSVSQFDQPGMFSLAELDAVLPNNPVFVLGARFQGVQVNSRALQLLGLSASSPGVEADSSGAPSGRLTGPAQAAAGAGIIAQIDQLSIDDQANCLADFIRSATSLGLTAWNDPEGNQQPFNPTGNCTEFGQGLHDHQAVIQLWRDGRLNARITYHLMNNFSGLQQLLLDTRHPVPFMGDDTLRYLGTGEEVLCPGDQPAPDPGEYQAIANHLAANRMSFENHASANATQVALLNAWEEANNVYPLARLHWTDAGSGQDARDWHDAWRERRPRRQRRAAVHPSLPQHVRQRHPHVLVVGRDERRAVSAVHRPVVRGQR